jgi:hypothetical protein
MQQAGPLVLLTVLACRTAVLLAGTIIPNEYIVIFNSGVNVRAATVR